MLKEFFKRLWFCLKYRTPAVTVDVVIKRRDGAWVMIKRNFPPFKGYWALPGGFVEVGESVEHAAIRESKEETGLEVKLLKLVGVYSSPARDPRRHTISVAFLAKPIKGKLKSSEEGEVRWFKRFPEKIAFDHEKILRDVMKIVKKS